MYRGSNRKWGSKSSFPHFSAIFLIPNFEKSGFKFFWGMALFRDLALPVPVSERFVAGFLEADQVTKQFLNDVDFYFRFRVMRVLNFRKVATLVTICSHAKAP